MTTSRTALNKYTFYVSNILLCILNDRMNTCDESDILI